MATTQTFDIAAIERFLQVRGWERSDSLRDWDGHIWLKGRDEWRIELTDIGASIEKFTDADIPDDHYKGGFVAVGRFETVGQECYSLAELEAELVSLGAMPYECPYCGEAGGEPVDVYWTEYQGVSPHGGVVETTEERCTKCVRK